MIEMREILSLSALILAVLLVRAIFKNRVPKRMIYCLWLVVLLKLCLPGTLFSLPVLPAEDAAVPAQSAERPVQTAPVIQRPAQTVTKPQTPAQQPVSPVQETAKPTAKPLTTAQILQIVWFSGSALLGLWLFSAWAVFTIRLHRDRRFVGKRGGTCIYVSDAVKSPCLAGLVPAVYLTQDVLQSDEAEFILSHELTHLRHLDFLWSFCRTAAVIVYWWNPFIWLAAICSKRDAELACDEAVAAKLPENKRLAYARAILAQAPRKTAALSLAGPPVKERILFLTKKQRTSVLCVILALLLVASATGCSFAELTRRKTNAPASSTEEAQPKTEPQAEAVPEPTAEITQPERTLLEEELPVDETARAEWFDFAGRWRLDYLPVFSRGAAPASTSEYLMWVFARNMDALKEQGYMTKSYVETEIRAHFEVENLTHEGLTRTWDFDGETYTAVPGGVKDRPLARLDSVIRVNLGEEPQYCVQYCLLGNGNLLDDAEWSRCRDAIVSGDAPDLSELREFTLVFTMQDGEPVFLSHTELNIEEPPFTPLPNDGTYDVTQPLQDWELTRTNGVQTGMTQAQVEAITGPLTENENGILMDSQNISYNFWDRSESESEPKLTEMIWIANVENDELVYTTSQDVPAFRGICLGDTIDEVFDQFPCTDRELKRWETQYVYGYEGADNYAVLHLIADSFYTLDFYIQGQWRVSIDFSRVQQRVFQIQIYGETYWQDMNQTGEEMAARAQTMTLTVSSGEKYTLSDADTAAVEEIYSDDSMRPGGWESVCVYQFDIRNCSYRLDETFELAETIVRIDADHYEHYMKRLTRNESETMRTLIDRYRPNALQPVRLRSVTADSVTAEHIILLNSYLAEDLQTLNDLYIPPEDYQYGYYYRRISDKTYTYTVDPDAPATIYDISQVYGAGEDRLYTFENWQDFVTAVQADEGLLIQPYVLTIQNGVVTKLEEKFYN